MSQQNSASPTLKATLGRQHGARRRIAQLSRAVAAGAFWAVVVGCTPTGAGDVGATAVQTLDSDGTFWFVDAPDAGVWETSGSARVNGYSCQWNLFTDPPGDVEDSFGSLDWADYQIDRGDVAVGETARVTLPAGDYFTSVGCAAWRRVR